MGSALKGTQITSEMFKIIIILLIMVVFVAVAFLLSIYYNNWIREHINSEQKICETFEKEPLFGTIRCPAEGPLEKFLKFVTGKP